MEQHTYNTDKRFDNKPLPIRGCNQYSKMTWDKQYRWVIGHTIVQSSPRNIFKCWVIPNGTKHFSHMPNGSTRTSFNGKRPMSHVFVWLYHNGRDTVALREREISHLCANERCCRPSHLIAETHLQNMQRINCLGYVLFSGQDESVVKLCPHTPPCKKVTVYDNQLSHFMIHPDVIREN